MGTKHLSNPNLSYSRRALTAEVVMENLKKMSIEIVPGTIAVWPQFGQEEVIHVEELRSKFPSHYATNNSTICFVDETGKIFVTPYTRKAIVTLKEASYKEATFYVPFSNWDYPKHQKTRWLSLKEEAEKVRHEEFSEDCIKWCDQHGVGSIDPTYLDYCFKIPQEGVAIFHPRFQTKVFPAITAEILGCNAINVIGTYNANNGKVAFVYQDGCTYVAKGYWIIRHLRKVGYREGSLFVPFSNGEEITDPYYRRIWQKIPKNPAVDG